MELFEYIKQEPTKTIHIKGGDISFKCYIIIYSVHSHLTDQYS